MRVATTRPDLVTDGLARSTKTTSPLYTRQPRTNRGRQYERFRERLAAYLTHYNETRIKKSLGWQSPMQYRKSLGLVA